MKTKHHTTRRALRFALTVALALLVAGCIPTRIGWSPDGQRAFVLADDGLRFCDVNGKLGDLQAQQVKAAAWTPDGKQLVYAANTGDDEHAIAIAPVTADGLGEPTQLAATEEAVMSLRIAPDGGAVLYTVGRDAGDDDNDVIHGTWVVSTTGGDSRLLNDRTSAYPDWTADSKHAVYFRQVEGNTMVGELLRQKVRDDAGRIAVDDDTDTLAGLVFATFGRVRCLKDGRVLFNSIEITLPVTENDVPQQQQLFVLDPARRATLARLIPRGTLGEMPNNVSYYTVSPDEKRLAVLGDEGRVLVFDIAVGDAHPVQTGDFDDNYTMPAWRNPNELTVLAPNPDGKLGPHAREVLHLKLDDRDKPTVLSADWPDPAAGGWLGKHNDGDPVESKAKADALE